MRRFVAGGLLAAILIVLGVGLLPPLLARHALDEATTAAARAGSAAMAGGAGAADAAATKTIAAHHDMRIVSMGPVPGPSGFFAVTVQEHVHTFMDRLGVLSDWFVVTSTEQAQAGR